MFFDRFNSKKEEELKELLEAQNKKINKMEKLANTHHEMLNNIYVFYKLKPTPFMATIREVGYEMMKFVDNVCKKYDIQWWLDYGTLLGAIRHQDFVPWDDDLDSGMMRADLNVFMDVIDDEISENNLEYIRAEYKRDKHSDLRTKRWFQFKFNRPDFYGSFCTLDIFQYDYIKDYDGSDAFEEAYYDCMREWFTYDQHEDMVPHLEKVFEKLNLTLEADDYIISGVEGPRGKIKMYPYKVLKADEVFPLKRMKFGKYDLPVPQSKDYIKYIYGKNYMRIPNKVRDHKRLNRYVEKENIMEVLQHEVDLLKKANRNFEK